MGQCPAGRAWICTVPSAQQAPHCPLAPWSPSRLAEKNPDAWARYRLLQSPAHCRQLLTASPLPVPAPALSPSPFLPPTLYPLLPFHSQQLRPFWRVFCVLRHPSSIIPSLSSTTNFSSFFPFPSPSRWTASHPKTRNRLKQKRKSPRLLSPSAPPSFR